MLGAGAKPVSFVIKRDQAYKYIEVRGGGYEF